MGKRVFMFPGQGSQYIGMGKEFYDTMPNAKAVIDLASEQTGLDIPALCFEENDKLNITEYTQICMLAVEAAIYQAIIDKGITPDVTAGLSLGEYGALIASGAMTMADAFAVVRKRGIYMQEAVPTGGAMTAVLGLDPQVIEDICKKTVDETNSVVSVANYNCPGQIVITGPKPAVEEASVKLKEAGARRVLSLAVSGPFHSSLLQNAGKELEKELSKVELSGLKIPYVTNVTAQYVTDISETKNLLARQISSSVLWLQSVEKMIQEGVDTFVEIGPGKTLAGFMKKIAPEMKTYNIQNVEDLEQISDLIHSRK